MLRVARLSRWRRTWLYLVIYVPTGRIIYVGQSVNDTRRWLQHLRAGDWCDADAALFKTYLNSLEARGSSVRTLIRFERVKELPDGVPYCRADEFEAHFISVHNTVHCPRTRPDVYNSTAGNNLGAIDYDAVAKEVADGYDWSADAKLGYLGAKERAQLKREAERYASLGSEQRQAEAELAVVADVEEVAACRAPRSPSLRRAGPLQMDPSTPSGVGPTVRTWLTELHEQALTRCNQLVALGMVPHAWDDKIAHYGQLPADAHVTFTELSAVLTELREVSRIEHSDDLRNRFRAWAMAAHPDRKPEGSGMKAKAVAVKLAGYCEELRENAEAGLDLENGNVQLWRAVRTWSYAHNCKRPYAHVAALKNKHTNYTDAEIAEIKTLGNSVNTWHKRGMPDRASVDLIMRDEQFDWYRDLVEPDRKQQRQRRAAERVNAHLRAGHGLPGDPGADPSKGAIPSRNHLYAGQEQTEQKGYIGFMNWLGGSKSLMGEVYTHALAPERVAHYWGRHEANATTFEASSKKGRRRAAHKAATTA